MRNDDYHHPCWRRWGCVVMAVIKAITIMIAAGDVDGQHHPFLSQYLHFKCWRCWGCVVMIVSIMIIGSSVIITAITIMTAAGAADGQPSS